MYGRSLILAAPGPGRYRGNVVGIPFVGRVSAGDHLVLGHCEQPAEQRQVGPGCQQVSGQPAAAQAQTALHDRVLALGNLARQQGQPETQEGDHLHLLQTVQVAVLGRLVARNLQGARQAPALGHRHHQKTGLLRPEDQHTLQQVSDQVPQQVEGQGPVAQHLRKPAHRRLRAVDAGHAQEGRLALLAGHVGLVAHCLVVLLAAVVPVLEPGVHAELQTGQGHFQQGQDYAP